MSESSNLGPSSNLIPVLQQGSFILFSMNVYGFCKEENNNLAGCHAVTNIYLLLWQDCVLPAIS